MKNLTNVCMNLYKKGYSQEQIGKKLHMTDGGAAYHLKKHPNWELEKRHLGKDRWTSDRKLHAKNLYLSGLHQREVAKILETNQRQISQVLNELKVEMRKSFRFESGNKNLAWKGGQTVGKGGYLYIYAPDHPQCTSHGYVLKHRLVMEKHIGRYLRRDEVIHHKNGNSSDNRIRNLQLFDSNADHLRETLKGHIPKWTEAGRNRILASIRSKNKQKHKKSHSKSYAPKSQKSLNHQKK